MKEKMANQVKLRVRVYSDCDVEFPEAYFDGVFRGYEQYWKLIESDDPQCILCETYNTYSEDDELGVIYDRITPEMYQSTYRTYRIV